MTEGSADYIEKLLQSLRPSEVLVPKNKVKEFNQHFGSKFYTYPMEDWVFAYDFTREKLLHHFSTNSLKGFGMEEMKAATIAAGSALHYLGETEHKKLEHITGISKFAHEKHVWLDRFTIRNLELLYPMHEGGTPLLEVLDHTISPMGGRLLKKWIALPLKDKKLIDERHSAVEFLVKEPDLRDDLEKHINEIGDMERLISKVPMGKINPREVVQLKRALSALEPIKALLELSLIHI